jgi:hypothetical protein
MRYSIVGQRHCGETNYNEGVLPGTPVLLVREPDNRFDRYAVQVRLDGKRIGYLSSKGGSNMKIAIHIDKTGRTEHVEDIDRKVLDAVFCRSISALPQVDL